MLNLLHVELRSLIEAERSAWLANDTALAGTLLNQELELINGNGGVCFNFFPGATHLGTLALARCMEETAKDEKVQHTSAPRTAKVAIHLLTQDSRQIRALLQSVP